jgi:hypothetical protein
VATLEGFVSRVFPYMPGQLVRSGKLPRAPRPGALVGLLSRVGPQVGLQVGALGVDLPAAGEFTAMSLFGAFSLIVVVIVVIFTNIGTK